MLSAGERLMLEELLDRIAIGKTGGRGMPPDKPQKS
jgi:hypothetical protein